MRVGIFCSANNQIDAVYFEKTAELGRWLAQNGHEVVFGGCNLGLMECVARAAVEAGGRTVGVVPGIIEEHGRTSAFVSELVMCKDLNERKALMLGRSDVFVALPGGVGTLDEVFTVVASYSIGYHRKRVVLYNVNGFWNSLIALLKDMDGKGVIRGDWRAYIGVADNLEELQQQMMISTNQ